MRYIVLLFFFFQGSLFSVFPQQRLPFIKASAVKKKVLVIQPWFVGGGMGTAFVAMLNNLPDQDIHFDICILAQAGKPFALIRKDVSYIDMAQAVKKTYDTVVCYAQWTKPELWIPTITAKRRVQWIHCDGVSGGWANRYKHRIPKLKKVDAFVLVSEAAKKNFLKSFPQLAAKTYAVYNIIDNAGIRSKSLLPQTDMPKEEGVLNVVTVARLSPDKGLDTAVLAHAQLEKEGFHFRWYIIGEGRERENLEPLIQKHKLEGKYILMGFRPNPYPYIKDADIFALLSRAEGFGLVVTEAKILGRPIIVTNFPAAYEQIVSGKNGLIVQNDLGAICKGLKKLLTDQALRVQFSQALQGFEFSNQKAYARIREVLFGKTAKSL